MTVCFSDETLQCACASSNLKKKMFLLGARFVHGQPVGHVEMATTTSFMTGENFSSYEELSVKVKAYERERSVQLTLRDSRTLEAAGKRVPKRVEGANKSLLYYNIHLTCVFGGKAFKSKGTGRRSHHRWVIRFTLSGMYRVG